MNVEPGRMALTPAEKMKRLRAARKKRGECSRCGRKLAKVRTNCVKCNKYAKASVYCKRAFERWDKQSTALGPDSREAERARRAYNKWVDILNTFG